jgi:ElaA protein
MRSEVFVVEQNCIYQDIDYKDQKAIHVLLKKNKELIGYTRIFNKGDYFKNASIGRVLVSKNNRENNYGSQLMEASIKVIKTKFKVSKISISAQTYLKQFYNNLGFKVTGEEYLEDGIPHIAMIKTNL